MSGASWEANLQRLSSINWDRQIGLAVVFSGYEEKAPTRQINANHLAGLDVEPHGLKLVVESRCPGFK